jgi:serine/threonine protein kinase
MQAIMSADYSFEPEEYWQDVSDNARDFISKCLKVEASQRMTSDECLEHPFLKEQPEEEADLLPTVMSNMNLRKLGSSTNVQATGIVVESGPMDGAYSQSPENARPPQRLSRRSSTASARSREGSTGSIDEKSGMAKLVPLTPLPQGP